ncbi:hypothetical protein [Levilactobacillus spicheri]|uniref:WxL domain-containing protein n=1 Tax=Levilactobacillus spicheri TaxID=216463 RepID=A0ABQ0WL30_9LACO|nr:hypothetical protein [Levilactobacillus spicheri]GEO65681.1 hypothetical protein LSP04_01000 [Levilactobacillus spicheri]
MRHHLALKFLIMISVCVIMGSIPNRAVGATTTEPSITRGWTDIFTSIRKLLNRLNPLAQKQIKNELEKAKNDGNAEKINQINQAAKGEAEREKNQQATHYFGFASAPGKQIQQTPDFKFKSTTVTSKEVKLSNIPQTDFLSQRDTEAVYSSPIGISNFRNQPVKFSLYMDLSPFTTSGPTPRTLPDATMHLQPTSPEGPSGATASKYNLSVNGRIALANQVSVPPQKTWTLNLNQPTLELPRVIYAGDYQATITYTIVLAP